MFKIVTMICYLTQSMQTCDRVLCCYAIEGNEVVFLKHVL